MIAAFKGKNHISAGDRSRWKARARRNKYYPLRTDLPIDTDQGIAREGVR